MDGLNSRLNKAELENTPKEITQNATQEKTMENVREILEYTEDRLRRSIAFLLDVFRGKINNK